MKKLRVGVVGCGWNSDNHLRVYRNSDKAILVAVCDRHLAKAEEKARRYGVKEVFSQYESMIERDLDLVDIVTPTPTHKRLTTLALESGHNVLVEKPMALSSEQCKTMIDAAEKNGKTLSVCHTKRFFDCMTKMKETIELEKLNVSRMRLSHFFALPHVGFGENWILTEESGGVLWDGLVHHAYLTEYFLGETQSVLAVANRVNERVYDSITLLLRNHLKQGVCEFVWNVREPLQQLQLITAEGDRFDADLPHDLLLRRSRPYKNRRVTALRSFSDDLRDPFVKWTQHFQNVLTEAPYERALPFEMTFFTLIERYLSFLGGESSSPPVMAEEGLRSVKVLEAARRSIETGKTEHPM